MDQKSNYRRVGIIAAIAELLSENTYRNIGRKKMLSENKKTITNKILRRTYGKSGIGASMVKRGSLKVKNRRKYRTAVKRSRAK